MDPPTTETPADGNDAKSLKNESNAALGSRIGSGKSNKDGAIPPANMESADNPSADLRNMRRIIAEDSEWNLATVPLLVDICINHVVQNFESKFFL